MDEQDIVKTEKELNEKEKREKETKKRTDLYIVLFLIISYILCFITLFTLYKYHNQTELNKGEHLWCSPLFNVGWYWLIVNLLVIDDYCL